MKARRAPAPSVPIETVPQVRRVMDDRRSFYTLFRFIAGTWLTSIQ